jgi:branched-chain amino acid transport system substrate-binding protein
MAAEMLASGILHIVGCYTSSSRKEIIPLFEKADALLWRPLALRGLRELK